MSFTCRYCGKKFCSEHRLPENHDCEGLEEAIEKEKEETDRWFREKDKDVKKPAPSQVRQPSLIGDMKNSLQSNMTLTIILVTVFSFMLQLISPFYSDLISLSPALTTAQVASVNQAFGQQILSGTLLSKPWTIVTIMLAHDTHSILHIFANMVTFYFFGTPLERNIGGKKLLKFYVGAGIVASLAFVAFRNLLYFAWGPSAGGMPTMMSAVGASGAVIACFAAVAMLYPEAEVLLYFIIPMKIKTALYAFAGFEVIGIIAKSSGFYIPIIGQFASSAHLAGIVVGLWYGKRLRDKYAKQTPVLDILS